MSTNPYVAFQSQAAAFLFIDGGKDLQNALTVFQILLGVSLLMTLISIAIRVYKREKIWLFRLSNGFITPHYVFSSLLFSFFFIILELLCLQSMRKFGYIDNTDRRDTLLWRSTRFLPLWLGGMMLLWATTLAPVLNRPPTASRYDLARHPILVNSAFIFVPTLFITLAFTLIGIADARWTEALVVYTELKRQLDLAVVNADRGLPVDIFALQRLETELKARLDVMLLWWTRANANLTALVLFFAIAFGIASFTYLRDLQSTITAARHVQHPTRDSKKRLRSLRAIYSSLLVTTVAVEIIAINLFSVSLFVTCNLDRIGQDPKLAFQVTIWTFFIYPVFGLFLNGGVLFRSLMLLRTPSKGTSTTDSKLTIVPPPVATSVELKMLPSPTEDYSTKKMSAGRSFSLEDDAELHIRSESR